MFNVKQIVLPVAAAACFLIPSAVLSAQTTGTPATQTQKPGKTIKFTLQNSSSSPVDLKSGDQTIHLAAGQSQQVKAPAGTKIVTASDSSAGQAGTVVTEVTDTMGGATVNLR